MGNPVDPLFSDRDAFADFFTAYYTDYEPEHCLVAESDNGEVIGYIIAAAKKRRYTMWQAWVVLRDVPSILWKMVSGRYRKSDFQFLKWLLLKACRETPKAPKHAAHFHINILPAWRGEAGRPLFAAFFQRLPQWRIGRIYGQMQVYENRRSERVFKRFGFRIYDKRKVTKFDRFGIRNVHVATLVRDYRPKF